MPHININGKNLHYQEKGTGFPVVLSHSFLWDSNMWQPQLDALSQHYRCIAIDLWEHGQSDHLPHPNYSIEQLAQDHWELTQALKLDEFAFIGLSVGGMIGAHLAVNHPEAVKALALIGTFIGPESEPGKIQYNALLQQFQGAGRLIPELANAVVPFFFSPVTLQANPPFVQRFRQSLIDMSADRMNGIIDLGRAILINRNSLLDRLPELNIPTTIIVGQDDLARPPHESRLMAELIPGAQLTTIREAAHICCLEKPEEVTKELEKLLQRVNVLA